MPRDFRKQALGIGDVKLMVRGDPCAPGKDVDTRYSVTQKSTDGPIVEAWFDGQGKLVQQRSEGVTVQRCELGSLKRRWPRQFE